MLRAVHRTRVVFRATLLCSVLGLLLAQAVPASAATLKLTPVTGGYSHPVFVTHPGDGTNRLFVVEQAGRIWVRSWSAPVVRRVYLDISAKVSYGGERGLFSVAFHPDFESSDTSKYGRNLFVVNYTDKSGNIVIEAYRASSTASTASIVASRKLLTIPHPTYSNHNGGQVAFGRDGYLYISTGDGGGTGDPGENAQDKDSLLGKLLRISPERTSIREYGIPTSNPFYGSVAGRGEVWSYGLRNPWRFSFDRANGNLWIGDVGQGRYEEVDLSTSASGFGRGINWGWDVMEGTACYEPSSGCSTAGKKLPVAQYGHSSGRCSITGGYRYRGPSSGLNDRYLFADYCSGEVFSWMPGAGIQLLYNSSLNITSFGEGVTGKVYITATNGYVYRLDA